MKKIENIDKSISALNNGLNESINTKTLELNQQIQVNAQNIRTNQHMQVETPIQMQSLIENCAIMNAAIKKSFGKVASIQAQQHEIINKVISQQVEQSEKIVLLSKNINLLKQKTDAVINKLVKMIQNSTQPTQPPTKASGFDSPGRSLVEKA